MKVAIVDTKGKVFLARNNRWYSLKRSERAEPSPKVFQTKSNAIQFISDKGSEHPDKIVFVKPEYVHQTTPRKMSVRRATITCGGRK